MTNVTSKQQPPIYIVGLPRSGTSWLASILNTAEGIKYFYEPFNKDHVQEAAPHWLKYLRADDRDPEFAQFCQDAFVGRINSPSIFNQLSPPYKILGQRFCWLPGRVMVKDVHSCMSLEWVDRHISPVIVIVMRHPCALASSWYRTFKPTVETAKIKGLERLLSQPKLIEDYLQPFEPSLRENGGFWQKVAKYWGATYYVVLEQQRQHPDWIVVQHEDLCKNPVEEYRKLFDKLNLRWTAKTDQLLQVSTTRDSGKAYLPKRISSQEPDKWQKELEPWQIEQVRQFVKPFAIPYYSDL